MPFCNCSGCNNHQTNNVCNSFLRDKLTCVKSRANIFPRHNIRHTQTLSSRNPRFHSMAAQLKRCITHLAKHMPNMCHPVSRSNTTAQTIFLKSIPLQQEINSKSKDNFNHTYQVISTLNTFYVFFLAQTCSNHMFHPPFGYFWDRCDGLWNVTDSTVGRAWRSAGWALATGHLQHHIKPRVVQQ